MASVYANSYLNLGAAVSNSSSGGLFCERDPRDLCPVIIGSEDAEEPSDIYLLAEKDPMRAVDDSPLVERAWVLQEQCLAPRTLYFTSTQLFWECAEMCASETFPQGHDHRLLASGCVKKLKKGFNASLPESRLDWFHYVTVFTRRKLTYTRDRLPAISALARLEGARRGTCEVDYLAGIWRHSLPDALLWIVYWPRVPETEYVAPSWSWASVNGTLRPRWDDTYRAEEREVTLTIVEAKTMPKGDPFGQVISGYLRVRGRLAKLHFPIPPENGYEHRNHDIQEINSTPSQDLYVSLDPRPLDPSYHHKGYFFFLEVCRSDSTNDGLVLEHVSQYVKWSASRGTFRRVGLFAAGNMNHPVMTELPAAYNSQSLSEEEYEGFEDVDGDHWYTITII